MPSYLLAIDQGTTSTRAIIFSTEGQAIAQHQIEFKQYFPQADWVEHDPEEIWNSVINCCKNALSKANLPAHAITAIGITNQRETTLIWDKTTGKALYPAIVWQDRRTTEYCQKLSSNQNIVQQVQQKTGLLLDPYFSASKINWLLNHIPEARRLANRGELAFGTIDSFLLWRFTKGQQHATDATNASRTLLFNIHKQSWDEELLELFQIPATLLPLVLPNNADFGETEKSIFGHAIPITGMAGDQQAALIGQTCFTPGMIKSTYGTGCFLILNTGKKPIVSKHRLITTVAYRLGQEVTYGLEGSIFVAGAAVQWLRDALRLIANASDTQNLASSVTNTDGVYLVPAFTGLGAPYWDPSARGALLGLTRNTSIAHIVRAALEAVCYQTRDLMSAMQQDYQGAFQTLRIDGGMAANDWLLQFLSDILNLPIERPKYVESSALGAAYLAGLGAGVFSSLVEISNLWQKDRSFHPTMNEELRESCYRGWQEAVKRVLSTITD